MIGVVVNAKAVAKKLEGISPDMAKIALRGASLLGAEIVRSARSNFNPGTGKLSRSFLPARLISGGKKHATAGAFSDLVYAAIQEFGGTILPRRAKHLAIPLNAAAKKKGPREWPDGKLRLLPKSMVLATVEGKGKITPMYALRKSVKLKGKRYIGEAVDAIGDKIEDMVAKQIAELITSAGGK